MQIRKLNILLINHYAGSPKYGMEYRPYYLAREWLKQGHSVTIVAASQTHLRTVQPKTNKDVEEEMIDGIRYLWLLTPGYSGNGVMRVCNMLTFVRRLFTLGNELAQSFRPDLVIASSTYPLDIYPARWIAGKAGARLIFEVHDLWPLSPMELGNMSRWHPFIMAMQCAENYAYCRADKVVSMLPNAKDHMCEHGMAPEKFSYIPNGISVNGWLSEGVSLPEHHENIISRFKEQGKFLIGYAGAHGIANALDSLILSAGHIPNDIAIILIGNGPVKENLQKIVQNKLLQNVFFLPPIIKESIPAILAEMDGLFIGLQKQPLFRFGVSPNKLMDYMMAGKPIIYAIEAGNDPVFESGCGISVEPENAAAIADAIIRLKSMSPAERKRMGEAGKDYVLAHHDYGALAKEFIRAIEAA